MSSPTHERYSLVVPDRLPALSALRAFEAAARHLSFQAAAGELNVSPSAVSHAVRALEADLGRALFVRGTRAVSLTEAGRAMAPGLADGFESIERAVRRAREVGARPTLTLSTGPAIAAKWIVPRLYAFEERHPEIDVRITTSLRLVDLAREGIDAGIRFGRGPYPDLDARRLFGDALVPLASPAIAATLREPADLLAHRLIVDRSTADDDAMPRWADWFAAVGVPPERWGEAVERARTITQAHHTIQAVMDGAGVALGRLGVAAADMEAGRLVAPFGPRLPTPHSFWFVTGKGRMTEPPIAAFLGWLGEEIDRQAEWLPE